MTKQPEIEVQRRRKAEKPSERTKAPTRRQSGGCGERAGMPVTGGGFSIPSRGKIGSRGDSTASWNAACSPEGDYLVGFMVSDLDSNTRQAFTRISMR